MRRVNHERTPMMAAERQLRILQRTLRDGLVKVSSLAEELEIGENTVRNDLDALHREGKLVRVRGGAMASGKASPSPPYSETRMSHLHEKSAIGKSATAYVPESGTIFIGSGTTTHQLASRLPMRSSLRVVTNGLEIAGRLASTNTVTVDFLGGTIRPDSLTSDASLSEEALPGLHWDVAFIGAPAIDIVYGITTLDRGAARTDRILIEHGVKVIVLCDSSKLGRFSYAQVGPVTIMDTLITDSGVDEAFVVRLREMGVEVVVASDRGNSQ